MQEAFPESGDFQDNMLIFLRWAAAAYMVAVMVSAVRAGEFGSPAPSGQNSLRRADAELVVTGEKTDRALQDTIAAVSVTTGQAIADQNLLTLYDILDRTPNVAVDGNRTTFSIRGIDAFNVSGGGDGPLATVYLDGAAIPRLALSLGPLDLHDVAQVEVFRGPQSMIQGRNALAGSVIIRTADPGFEWTGQARLLMLGKDGQRRASIAAGGPLIGDQVAFRLAGEISRADGLIHNVTTHADADRQRSESLRGETPDQAEVHSGPAGDRLTDA